MEKSTSGAAEGGAIATRRPKRAASKRSASPASKVTRKAGPRRKRAAAPVHTTLFEDVGAMASQIGEYTWGAGQRAADATNRVMKDGRRTAARAVADVEHGVEGALDIGGRYGGMLAERFRERPLATVASIGAMAMLAGWLFGARR